MKTVSQAHVMATKVAAIIAGMVIVAFAYYVIVIH